MEPACPNCGSTSLTADPTDHWRVICDNCGEASRWGHTVFFRFGDEHLPLSAEEARAIAAKLRLPLPGAFEGRPAAIAAAVFLERLADEPDAVNPPLQPAELHEIGLALTRLEVTDGLSQRQTDVRDAILAHLL